MVTLLPSNLCDLFDLCVAKFDLYCKSMYDCVMKSVLVYNPESGRGKLVKRLDYITRELEKKYGHIDVVPSLRPGHVRELAANAIGIYQYFFVAGGDGTLNEAINGFAGDENSPIIGYIPCGTVNDVARSLGLKKNIKKSIKCLLECQSRQLDIFKANENYGLYVCCAGLFTKSSYSTGRSIKKHFGRIAYFIKGFKEFFSTKPLNVVYCDQNNRIEKSCSMILIINSKSVAGFKLNKNVDLCDGRVEVVLFHSGKNKIRLRDKFRILKAFVFGLRSVKKNKMVTYLKSSKFCIKIDADTTLNLDGEKHSGGDFEFEVINKGIKIICP